MLRHYEHLCVAWASGTVSLRSNGGTVLLLILSSAVLEKDRVWAPLCRNVECWRHSLSSGRTLLHFVVIYPFLCSKNSSLVCLASHVSAFSEWLHPWRGHAWEDQRPRLTGFLPSRKSYCGFLAMISYLVSSNAMLPCPRSTGTPAPNALPHSCLYWHLTTRVSRPSQAGIHEA